MHSNIEGSNEDIVLENEFLEFRFLPQKTEIILRDKVKGTVWRSNPPVGGNDSQVDPLAKLLMESQFTLEYADVSGVGMTLYSGNQSVENGNYSYELVDGGLEVNYTVGNIARIYFIPPALAEERMLQYLDQMEPDDRSRLSSTYRLYDIDNLRANDNRMVLLAQYPDLAHNKLYILRDVQEYQRAFAEEAFAAAGYTFDDYLEDSAHYPLAGDSEKPIFNVTLRYTLEGKSLVLNVPFDKIAYRKVFPMVQLSLMPYMGAGGFGDQGYILVPDGSGALIRFNNGRQSQITYSNSVYGWDEGMPRDVVINDNKAAYPVFGVQKNGVAMLCIIEEGASYASVRADVARPNNPWNSVYPRFNIVHGAKMDISSRSERAIYLYEESLPEGEGITLRYTLCDEDGYVGMAKEYRSWLLQRYPSLGSFAEGGVPIAVEIPGAVNKTQHRLGIPFDLPLRLTSYKEAEGMINDFAGFGWKNVKIKLNGWFNRSIDHSPPTRVKLISDLGSKNDFKNLVSAAGKNGYDIYPEVDFLFIKDKKPFDGFSLYGDAARYVSRKRIEKYPFSFVWFGERNRWGKLSYLARPASMMTMIDGFSKKSSAFGLNNIAFRSMGSVLSGDYNERRPVSREASMQMQKKKLAEVAGSGKKILVNTGFVYSVPWASFITDLALDDQKFAITDDAVPFYQIALHGLVPYTGRAINLAEDYTRNLLKSIEGGAGLYFSFMMEETAELQETKFRQFYANEYNKWVKDADALYKKFNADFGSLYSQAIVDHKILAPEVTLTAYEDGTRVIVNAGDSAWLYREPENPEHIINARDYIVLPRGK
jgi:hypothetical protein